MGGQRIHSYDGILPTVAGCRGFFFCTVIAKRIVRLFEVIKVIDCFQDGNVDDCCEGEKGERREGRRCGRSYVKPIKNRSVAGSRNDFGDTACRYVPYILLRAQ